MSVSINPGCTSYTEMFSAPSRAANTLETIAAAAFDAQYSARGTATATAFDEVTLTMEKKEEERRVTRPSKQAPRKGLAKKERSPCVDRQAAIPTLRRHVERVAAAQHRNAGVVDERRQRSQLPLRLRQAFIVAADIRDIEWHDRNPPACGADPFGSLVQSLGTTPAV